MSRYNYFDDEPEEKVGTSHNFSFDIRTVADTVRDKLDDIVHGNTIRDIKEIREMPNLRAIVLKLTAFLLFIIAIIVFILGFSHTISKQNKKNEKFYTDAGKVCTDYINQYGVPKWERLDSDDYGSGMARLTGLCYARHMDFNSDGDDELMQSTARWLQLGYSEEQIGQIWGGNVLRVMAATQALATR